MIVANLPYVAKTEKALVQWSVKKYEPASSLWAGEDGLFFIKKLLWQLKKMRCLPRFLICEIGFSMKPTLISMLNKIFVQSHTQFKKDLAGHNRLFVLYA